MIEKNLLKRVITSLILIFILFSMFVSSTMMLIVIIVISSITFYEFNRLIFNIYNRNFLRFLISGTVLLYLFIFVFIVFFIESVQMVNPSYKLFFFYSIIVSITSDIGGYIFGKLFKGKKLTKISPNKTISGSVGAFFLSLMMIPFFISGFNFININLFVLITITISLISQLGDLLISYLKRQANVKDTGNILPGHGGILDRIDGILFAAPIGLFLLDFVSNI